MKPLLDAAESEVPRLSAQAERFGRDALVSMVDQAAEAAATIRRSENPRLAMELTLAEMAEASGRMSLAEISTRLLELEKRLGGSGGGPATDPPGPGVKKPRAKKTAPIQPEVNHSACQWPDSPPAVSLMLRAPGRLSKEAGAHVGD